MAVGCPAGSRIGIAHPPSVASRQPHRLGQLSALQEIRFQRRWRIERIAEISSNARDRPALRDCSTGGTRPTELDGSERGAPVHVDDRGRGAIEGQSATRVP